MQLESGVVSGFEALLRWQHPEHGLIDPFSFISVAEAAGLMVPIGWQTLPQALQQVKIWEKFSTQPFLTISINLSNKQFYQADLSEQIKHSLGQIKIRPSSIRLEISEEVIMENIDSAYETLQKLKGLGIQLQLESASGSHLLLNHLYQNGNLLYKQFDVLKVNRSLVSRIDNDVESLELVQAIASNAHDLGLGIVAVGVETSEQLTQLKLLKCKYGQGYLFSEPLAANAAQELLEKQFPVLVN